MNELVSLSMKPIWFYSHLDERSLFRNLDDIECIVKITHVDEGCIIIVDKTKCDWEEFADILSLFRRYNLDINLLLDIVPNDEVKTWFLGPERAWHSRLAK